MTTANAFGRLFPPSLFLIVGLLLSVVWVPDPVLLVVAMCAAAMSDRGSSSLSWKSPGC